MAHGPNKYTRNGIEMSLFSDPQYGHLMPDGTPDTRWQTAPIRGMSNVGNFLGDVMVGGLEGAQAIENWLDDKYNAVADWYNPQPDMMARGPLSRGPAYQRYVGRVGYFNDDRYFDHPDLGEHKRITTAIDEGTTEAIQDRMEGIPPRGYGEGQVDPGFYRTSQNPVYQNRIAINADDQYNMLPTDVIDKRKLRQNLHLNNSAANYFTEPFQEALPYTTGVAAGGTDTRSDWQKWKDSFKEDWRAK